jgi:hypothetical protein
VLVLKVKDLCGGFIKFIRFIGKKKQEGAARAHALSGGFWGNIDVEWLVGSGFKTSFRSFFQGTDT